MPLYQWRHESGQSSYLSTVEMAGHSFWAGLNWRAEVSWSTVLLEVCWNSPTVSSGNSRPGSAPNGRCQRGKGWKGHSIRGIFLTLGDLPGSALFLISWPCGLELWNSWGAWSTYKKESYASCSFTPDIQVWVCNLVLSGLKSYLSTALIIIISALLLCHSTTVSTSPTLSNPCQKFLLLLPSSCS